MRRSLSLLSLALFVAGCGAVTLPQARTAAPVAVRAKHADASVSQARLERTLAVLSGKTAADGKSAIPERGSTEGRAATRAFLSAELAALGYTVERHGYRKSGENLLAKLMASSTTDEFILVGAHMDSVRNAGADDNGTGSSAVLEAARVLRDLGGRKVNVIFAWFDEEELGLVGSEALARDLRKNGTRVTSVHTIDMMGWDSDGDNAVEIERPDGALWDHYQMVNRTHGLNLPLARTNSGDTDHVAFRRNGFQSVGLCEEWVHHDTTPHYHKKSDTYENIHIGQLVAGTKLLTAAVGDLSLGVKAPAGTRLPHDLFPGRPRHFHGEHGH